MENQLADQSSEFPVLVIGAAGLDMVGRLKIPQQAGEIGAVKTIPADIRVSFGGVGRNVAENLARLGQPVRLLTAVGKDQMGKEMLAHTSACGVDVLACLESENFPTSACLAVLDPEGEQHMVLEDKAVMDEVTAAFLRMHKDLIAQSSLVFIDANLSPRAIKTVISLAGWSRVAVCADATSIILAERLLPYLGSLMMVLANNAEATILCQNDPIVTNQETALQAARKLVNQGVGLVIIALAEFGVVYATSETSGHIPAVRTRILDPTGAGDALTATVLFGLLNHIPMDESVRLGVTAASLILRHRGTVFPYLSLEKLYDELLV